MSDCCVRVIGISYFQRVSAAIQTATEGHRTCIHVFTDDSSPDFFSSFMQQFPGAQLHLKPSADAKQTFHHLVVADVLLVRCLGSWSVCPYVPVDRRHECSR